MPVVEILEMRVMVGTLGVRVDVCVLADHGRFVCVNVMVSGVVLVRWSRLSPRGHARGPHRVQQHAERHREAAPDGKPPAQGVSDEFVVSEIPRPSRCVLVRLNEPDRERADRVARAVAD